MWETNNIFVISAINEIDKRIDTGDNLTNLSSDSQLTRANVITDKCNKLSYKLNYCNKDVKKIIVYDCLFTGEFDLNDLKLNNIKSIEFRKCTFNDVFNHTNYIDISLDFTECTFLDSFRYLVKGDIEEISEDERILSVVGCKINKDMFVKIIGGIYTISNSTVEGTFRLHANKYSCIHISHSNFNNAYLYGTNDERRINKLEFYGACKFNSFYIMNAQLAELYFKEFVNSGLLNISNINFVGENTTRLTIIDSSMGNTKVNSVDLEKIGEVRIENSDVSALSAIAVKWKYHITSSSVRGMVDIYRQLKKVLLNTDDRVGSIIFNSLELKYQKKLLLEEKNYKDYFLILFGEISDHGLDWFKALSILILSSLVFYSSIILSLNTNTNNFLRFISFIDPTKFDFILNILKENYSSIQLLNISCLCLYLLWKFVFFAITYQIIVSFRKFGRKA